MSKLKNATGVWEAVKGLNHPPGDKAVAVGEQIDDLLPSSVKVLLQLEAIIPVDDVARKLAAKHGRSV